MATVQIVQVIDFAPESSLVYELLSAVYQFYKILHGNH